MQRKIPKIDGYTKVEVLSYVKMKLTTDPAWAVGGCISIYNQQTNEEKKKHRSIAGRNGYGFNRHDAPLLTSIACKLKQSRQSHKDICILQIYMEKYAAQLICLAHINNKCRLLKVYLDYYYKRMSL
jgi:hypothetical protein